MVVPIEVKDEEIVIRGVYHSMNFAKNNILKTNVIRSPAGKDEVSVVRKNFCDIEFCRKHFLKGEGKNRNYWGFFGLVVQEVRHVNSDVLSTQEYFKEHADIVHGYVEIKDQELPLSMKIKLDQLMVIINDRLKRDETPEIIWNQSIL